MNNFDAMHAVHRLMLKIRVHEISGKIWNWIQEWLSNRKQRVRLQGCTSSWRLVLSGIPQGSVLGPLLFVIFINDIDRGILNWLLKFADDTKVFGLVNRSGDGQRLRQDLSRLFKWSHDWQMLFNIEKCKFCILVATTNTSDITWMVVNWKSVQKKKIRVSSLLTTWSHHVNA